MNSDRVGWRATITECDSPGNLEVTSNGGRSWRATKAGLTTMLRLKAFGAAAVFAVGTDDRCRARFRTIDVTRWAMGVRRRHAAGDLVPRTQAARCRSCSRWRPVPSVRQRGC